MRQRLQLHFSWGNASVRAPNMSFMEFTGISTRSICFSLSSFIANLRDDDKPVATPPPPSSTRCNGQPLLTEDETENLRKSAKFMDFRPRNDLACSYCHNLINLNVRGQAVQRNRSNKNDFDWSAFEEPLPLLLQQTYSMLEKFQTDFTGEEEEFLLLTEEIYIARFPDCKDDYHRRKKFSSDRDEFVKIFQNRRGMSASLRHIDYWGTRQQLLSAKVIADHVSPTYGPLDPVFGVLLHPTSGRTGPGDSGWIHDLLFDGDGPIAYHSAVHDAFGYLLEAHGIGPGYDYLGSWSVFNSRLPLSGQLSGIKFWEQALSTQSVCPCKHI